jgi:hypothetical protein
VSRLSSLLRHPVSIVGALITTAAAVVFLTLTVAAAAGLFANPYAGLVIFVALPAIFVLGLLLMPLGQWLMRRKLRRDPTASTDWPVLDFRNASVRRTALGITALTAVNIAILLLAGYGSLRWMESPSFCGQTCHTPMHPQYTAWQQTTHSRVACVQCHVGEGARSFVRYKLAGVRQLVHVIGNNYPRPIPASLADLRPALEVCAHCHDPSTDFGEQLRVSREYADDEANTETTTMLAMQVGGPGQPTSTGRAIHWHADPSLKIEYLATDPDRQTIPYVKVTRPDGSVTEYATEGTSPAQLPEGVVRVMDCIDCHNASAHRIAPTAEQAVDRAIASGRVGRQLPFVRREAVRLVKGDYPDQDAGLRAIEQELRQFYASHGSAVDPRALAASIDGVQATYRHNVFPAMKVGFGVYLDNLGHITSTGCFRCHDDAHVAQDGSKINADCSYCHKQIETPF